MPRRKSSKKSEKSRETKKTASTKQPLAEKEDAEAKKQAENIKTPKKKKEAPKNAARNYNPTYVLAGIAILALVVGIVIGLGVGGAHKSIGETMSFSKPVAYVITSPECDFCNDTLNQGLALLEQQFGLSDKDYNIVKISYNDPVAKKIYKEISKNNPKAAYLPTVVLEGNIQKTSLYKKVKEFADSRKISVEELIQSAGKYYVLAPISIVYRYDPNKPVKYFYIYTDNAQQLYRLAGQIMTLQQNLVVKFKPADSDYTMKMVGPTEIIQLLQRYIPTAEVEGNTLVVPKIKISVEAQKPILEQVQMYLQGQIGMGTEINATALPEDSQYFVVIDGPQNVLSNVVPPEWNSDNGKYYVLRTDRPTVDLFVMSYCPFGLQAEKAILPVIQLLGNKVNFRVRFVNYAMHGTRELYENSRQYCIQELDANRFLTYLDCFTKTGDAQKCMRDAGINESDINGCMEQLDKDYNIMANAEDHSGAFPPFLVEDQLNKDYHVQGSPTLVVNNVPMGGTPRNPEALKEIICAAFLHPPEECNAQLSSENMSIGFGGTTGSSASGSCK